MELYCLTPPTTLVLSSRGGVHHSERGPLAPLLLPQETCDIIDVALYPHVLKSRGLAADVLLLTYLLIFGSYWAWSVVHFLNDVRDMVEVRRPPRMCCTSSTCAHVACLLAMLAKARRTSMQCLSMQCLSMPLQQLCATHPEQC